MKRRSRVAPVVKMGLVIASMTVLAISVKSIAADDEEKKTESKVTDTPYSTEVEIVTVTPGPTIEITTTPEPETKPIREQYEYPFNTVSADWSLEDVEGFVYYDIPEKFKDAGGYLPEIVQVYTYSLCEQYDVPYSVVLALIEKESWYKYNANGDDGKSKGYMQIYQKWHEERMEKVGCDDLMNPYGNIAVGIDYLAELTEKYEDIRLVLMFYNRGSRNKYETGALDLWEKGIYETEYSKYILERAAEIEKELEAAKE